MYLCPHDPRISCTQNHVYYKKVHAQYSCLLPRTLDCISQLFLWYYDLGTFTVLSGEPVDMTTTANTVMDSVTSFHLAWPFQTLCIFTHLCDILLFSLLLSSEYVFSLRSIPLLLSYITALIWATVEQWRYYRLQENCISSLALLTWELSFELMLTFQPIQHRSFPCFFLKRKWISFRHKSNFSH